MTDPKLLADFHAANNAVIAALKEYEQWLKTDLLPRSKGDFRLGADTYAKKLLYEEMVDIPLDRLLEIGYDDLRANQKRFAETAARIDPKQDAAADSGGDGKGSSRRRTSCSTRSATRWAG